MTRRRSRPPRPKRIDGALIVVQPGHGVVEHTAAATTDARALALAKRAVERALMQAGTSKRQALAILRGMSATAILAEAERTRAAAVPVPPPVRQHAARPWWQRLFARRA